MNVVDKWTEDGYMVQMQPCENLLDNLQTAQVQFLVTSVNSRSFGSNGVKVAAAMAFLLLNPDATLDDDDVSTP